VKEVKGISETGGKTSALKKIQRTSGREKEEVKSEIIKEGTGGCPVEK